MSDTAIIPDDLRDAAAPAAAAHHDHHHHHRPATDLYGGKWVPVMQSTYTYIMGKRLGPPKRIANQSTSHIKLF